MRVSGSISRWISWSWISLEPDFFELDFLEPASDLHWAGKSALHNEI
jgi:hypothetical protein